MYCVKCGAQLKKESLFCSKCGISVPESNEKKFGTAIAKFALSAAKAFCLLLMGGIVGACSVAAVGLICVACYMFYGFATGGVVIFPWLFAGELVGISLVFGGIMAAFIGILFIMAVIAMIRCMGEFAQKKQSE